MKLRIFLLLILFFSSFSVFAYTKAEATLVCSDNVAYWTRSGVSASCVDKLTYYDVVAGGTGGYSAGHILGSIYYDIESEPDCSTQSGTELATWTTPHSCVAVCANGRDSVTHVCKPIVCDAHPGGVLDTTVDPPQCRYIPICVLPLVNNPLPPYECIHQCVELGMSGGVSIKYCANDNSCHYQYTLFGISKCMANPPTELTCPDNVTKVLDLAQCPAVLQTCPDNVTKVTDLSQCPVDKNCSKYGANWVWNEEHGGCVSTDTTTTQATTTTTQVATTTTEVATTTTEAATTTTEVATTTSQSVTTTTSTVTTTTQSGTGTGTGTGTGIKPGDCLAGDACTQNTGPIQKNTKDTVTVLERIEELLKFQILKDALKDLVSVSTTIKDAILPSEDPNKKSVFDNLKDLIEAAANIKQIAQGEPDICEKNPDIAACKKVVDCDKNPTDKSCIKEKDLCEKYPDSVMCMKVGESLSASEIKEKEIKAEFEKKMSSSGSCPAPIVFSGKLYGAQEISYQPFCDFASLIKPLVLACFGILALRIVSPSIKGY